VLLSFRSLKATSTFTGITPEIVLVESETLTLLLSSLIFAFLLKIEDKRKGYGLELPNIEK